VANQKVRTQRMTASCCVPGIRTAIKGLRVLATVARRGVVMNI
jgi:hypothetical protein